MKPTVIDVFSGCGGMSSGFASSGYEVLCGIDNWGDALETFAENHPGASAVLADLADPASFDVFKEYEGVDVIVGGPPCQGFSIAGKRDPSDPRNRLYEGFLAAVRIAEPQAFVMENVPNVASMSSGALLEAMLADFADLGYQLTWHVMTASDYGVPQRRRRFVMVGTRWSPAFKLDALPKLVPLTSSDAWSDLPEDSLEPGAAYPAPAQTLYQEALRAGSDGVWNHVTTAHTDRTRAIISLVPDGGNYKDLPEHLRGTRRVNIAWTRFPSDRPGFTIDTGHRHHFHYKYNRVPTVRESARMQSFPDTFRFSGSKTSQYRQVGNAVPPVMAATIADQLSEYLIV